MGPTVRSATYPMKISNGIPISDPSMKPEYRSDASDLTWLPWSDSESDIQKKQLRR